MSVPLIKCLINSLSAKFTKWTNTLKQFVGFCRVCLSVFDHFVGLALKGLNYVLARGRIQNLFKHLR